MQIAYFQKLDYTKTINYEFDFGSEWTRAKSLDTCEF